MVHFRWSQQPPSSFSFASPTRGSGGLSFCRGGGRSGGGWGSAVTPLQAWTQTWGRADRDRTAGRAGCHPSRQELAKAGRAAPSRGEGPEVQAAQAAPGLPARCSCGTSGQGRQSHSLIPCLSHPQFGVLPPHTASFIPVLPPAPSLFQGGTPPSPHPSPATCSTPISGCYPLIVPALIPVLMPKPFPSLLPHWEGQCSTVALASAQRNDLKPSHNARTQGHGLTHCLPGMNSCLQSLV